MTCAWCGEPLATSNRRARYCSAACRSMAHRHGPRAVPIRDRAPKRDGAVTAIVRRELLALGLDDNDALARAAMACARAIDSPATPTSALVALTKELPLVLDHMRGRAAPPAVDR